MVKVHLIRIAILLALLTTGLLGIFSIPMDNSDTWYSDLLLSKISGAVCIWAFHRLYEKWKRIDSWIRAYDKWNEEQG